MHLQAVVKYDPRVTGPRDMIEAVDGVGYEGSLWKDAGGDPANEVHE